MHLTLIFIRLSKRISYWMEELERNKDMGRKIRME